MLVFANEHADICDYRPLAENGPATLAHRLRERYQVPITRPVNILLAGSSFLRQVFIAMGCIWRHQLTDGLLQQGGPNLTLKDLLMRNITNMKVTKDSILIQRQEWGQMVKVPMDGSPRDCHGPVQDLSLFYRSGVDLPQNPLSPNCNTDFGMLEFNGNMRLWYHFHPSFYANPLDLYKSVGLEQADLVLYNDGEQECFTQEWRDSLFANHTQLLEYQRSVHRFNVFSQYRDLHHWYGADNPWIDNPPDAHPCMPGVPDDMVVLMMAMLIHDTWFAEMNGGDFPVKPTTHSAQTFHNHFKN
jgi:hypothetical protein